MARKARLEATGSRAALNGIRAEGRRPSRITGEPSAGPWRSELSLTRLQRELENPAMTFRLARVLNL